ncbi:MBL fold metallo-hydrolase [Methylovorus mays]|uniref:MBL fold metallo-hydrolase n=1 Tax=Methylovorus mays TaxID=184077 RepID=UPI001E5260A4|nr:MBL fold metallo-hydrolase [Methylovorus mays]MCB5206318.1 MBL fold metallo-hydrolase [Methylovorus mays]
MQLTMLGVGSSAGTPVVGCQCATCCSSDTRNKRTRCSSAITFPDGEVVLIDTGPDLRFQALREGLNRVDAVLYTHTHADHLHGIDDLRAFCQIQRQQIPLYGKADALAHIADKFGYTIREPSDFWDLPVLGLNEIKAPFELFGKTVTPIPVKHGHSDILGFRIGNLAYLTDVSEIPEASLALLQGLDFLLLDCLRYKPHYTHINLEQSLEYAARIAAGNTYLIHMTHEMEYAAVTSLLPPKVHVGYDGLQLHFE